MSRLYIVGIGPGDPSFLCQAARDAIAASTDLVAYPLYLELLGELAEHKRHHALPLGEELIRARLALELAASGRTTALLSSGDAGIFAMASLVFELLEKEAQPGWWNLPIEVIPGISAMQAVASRVGAPLGHDFCVLSLSDLLTPWQTIETRIRAAGLGDFVVVFYNPASKQRDWQLGRAREILLEYRSSATPVILGRNLARADERVLLTTLAELDPKEVDMLTLVIIGNSETRRAGGWVYTPRGYRNRLGFK